MQRADCDHTTSDRAQEHLGTSDLAIIAARRMLLQSARDVLAGGAEPPQEDHNMELRPLGRTGVKVSLTVCDDISSIGQL